jgi:radical SAM protein with 4Fe4S-binding SPASM domain
MVNNRCLTNCVYCYADRREKIDCQISLSRIKELISESKSLNVASFSVIGGEFFLYKNWRELLLKLKEQNYSPFLSTKMPLKETDIAFLSEIKIQDLQISLDTLIPSHLQSILKVSADYVDNIKSTLTLLNKYNIKTYIHTIINSQNDSVMDMSSIFDYLKDFSNIEYWKPDLAGYSLYIQDSSYEQIKPLKSNLKKLEIYFQQIKQESKFSINFDGIIIKGDFIINNIEKETRFRNRAACTGNYSNLFILPDGKVTICEELYWHPQFIVGDVTKQDIVEIWNSNKAKNLFAYPQNLISEESVCSTCTQYDECRANKQVCWRDILKTYGEDRWFYPDVNCPKAPTPKYNITIQ